VVSVAALAAADSAVVAVVSAAVAHRGVGNHEQASAFDQTLVATSQHDALAVASRVS